MVRQSFFHDDSRNFIDVGGGVTGVRGFHSSFRLTEGGLSLNMGRNALILNMKSWHYKVVFFSFTFLMYLFQMCPQR